MAGIPEVDAALRAAAHGHRGRLVALLAVRTRDIAAAEDAVAEAIAQACMSWPRDGIPQNPAGWLLTGLFGVLALVYGYFTATTPQGEAA